MDDIRKIVFNRLLDEQSAILRFLTMQRTAVINGAAGTGKTMIAVRKAESHATEGEKVLFLCYNVLLKQFLEKEHYSDNIYYYTIAGLACKLCNTTKPDYSKLQSKLEDLFLAGSFPYDHIVIDEGQDFGAVESGKSEKDSLEELKILDTLKDIVTSDSKGSFYVFYDALQAVNSEVIPSYIKNADCKVTLYKNCRNTKNIAETSLKSLNSRKPEIMEGGVVGAPACIHYCNDKEVSIKALNKLIAEIRKDKDLKIVILTCKTEETGLLSGKTVNGMYMGNCMYSTCRKFKGLEADVVILVDFDENTFFGSSKQENQFLFYVGASRAKLYLHVITTITEEGCREILKTVFNKTEIKSNPKKELAIELNATGRVHL